MRAVFIIAIACALAVPIHGLGLDATCVDDNTAVVRDGSVGYLMVGDKVTITGIDADTVIVQSGQVTGRAGSQHFKVKYEQGLALLADALRQRGYTANQRQYSGSDLKTTPEIELFLRNSFGLAYADILRNEVFARHGDVFENKFYRDLFQGTGWYKLNPQFSVLELNGYEQANIKWLKENRGATPAITGDALDIHGLVAYYPFNGNARDASGNKHDGTLFGPTLTTDRFGYRDAAFSFNGRDNYIRLARAADLSLTGGSFALSAWINVSHYQSADHMDQSVIANDDIPGSGGCLHLIVRTNNQTDHLTFFSFYSEATSFYGKTIIAPRVWYHLTVCYDAEKQEMTMYINGQLEGKRGGWSPYSGTEFLNIGRYAGGHNSGGNSYFTGKIDDVRIFNRALAQRTVNELYHEGGWQQ